MSPKGDGGFYKVDSTKQLIQDEYDGGFTGSSASFLKDSYTGSSATSMSDSATSVPPPYSEVGKAVDSVNMGSEPDVDPWAITRLEVKSEPWHELTTSGKVKRVLWNYIFRQFVLIGLLYLFICSLDFLSSAFRLLGGKTAGTIFQESEVLSNPVAGLMIGVLVTVLLQSSSTSTSIVVSMVGANILTVKLAIPIIMGANIGTSITNTIVSIGQVGNRNEFRRAFGGATVHDMFNWLTVLILLPLEMASGYLELLSSAIVDSFNLAPYKDGDVKLLQAITEPFTKYIIKINSGLITKIAESNETVNGSLILMKCPKELNGQCKFMFMNVAGIWEDWVIGLILLLISLILLCTCLVLVVKILNSIFSGPMANILKRFMNADLPGYAKYFTGYLAILIGALLTMLLQSSSVFTSALTPLVGLGVLTIDRMYPLTLGSNIGTTFTAILSALAQDGSTIHLSIQISLCHLFFNVTGILLWYPIPFMRQAPLEAAKLLGNTVADYRWFAIVYMILAFLVLPAAVFGLSAAGGYVLAGVGIPILMFSITIVVINIIQRKKPGWLPRKLRSWDFLPLPLRSLEPYDAAIARLVFCCPCCKKYRSPSNSTPEQVKDANTIV